MACPNHPALETGLAPCVRCSERFCADCLVWLRGAAYCAACKAEQVRDLMSGIVPGALELASIGRRLVAQWLDGFITAAAAYALVIPLAFGIVAAGAGKRGEGLSVVLAFIMYPIFFAVPVVYEGLMLRRRGQTVGKIALGVKVVTPSGADISSGQAWGRAVLKLILGSCMGIDYLFAFVSREKTCLHDLIAKTRVVRVQQ
jgi:uncharacterized RDD family membrane protein YckC